MKNEILNKIKEMSLDGINQLKIKCSEYIIEMKLFKIGSVIILGISGAGVGFLHFFINNITDYNEIIKEIDIHVYRGIDLNIEDSEFIN